MSETNEDRAREIEADALLRQSDIDSPGFDSVRYYHGSRLHAAIVKELDAAEERGCRWGIEAEAARVLNPELDPAAVCAARRPS